MLTSLGRVVAKDLPADAVEKLRVRRVGAVEARGLVSRELSNCKYNWNSKS